MKLLGYTPVFEQNIVGYRSGKRFIINQGSSRSGKTYSILQLLYIIALKSEKRLVISVVSESMPHLKKGAIRDFEMILDSFGELDSVDVNRTDRIYSVGNSIIEFFGCDSSGKVHGPQRDILFINECQNISYDIFTQLNIRTKQTVFLDFNPVNKFWVHKSIMDITPESEWHYIHSTYADNLFLPKEQVKAIEMRKHDTDWWNVYGLGICGGRDGLVYDKYNTVRDEDFPTEFSKCVIGLDFGFTNDPTAIILCGVVNGELWLKEITYKTGLTNPDIASEVNKSGMSKHQIVADSAEMKSIAELRGERLRVKPCSKGRGSITAGITNVKRYRMNVHASSINLINELDQYRWKKDADGNAINEPIDRYNHALDAVRYGVQELSTAQTSVLNRIY